MSRKRLKALLDEGREQSNFTGAVPSMLTVLNSVLREPLLHFFILGVLLFAVDRARPQRDDPLRVEVTSALYRELSDGFEGKHGRIPTEEELLPIVDTWLTNEVLYREGRSLQLDQGDDMIRERVIQKMRVMVHGGVVVPEPTDERLQAFFDKYKDRYAQPELITFAHVEFGPDEAAAREMAESIHSAVAEGRALEAGDLRIIGFRARPRSNVEDLFGADFTAQLIALPPGEWRPIKSPRGWHLVRFDDRIPGREPLLSRVKNKLKKDWHQDEVNRRAWNTIKDVRAKYDIVRDSLSDYLRESAKVPREKVVAEKAEEEGV